MLYDDLAREEGVSQQAVAEMISRAKQRLRRLLPVGEDEKDRRFPNGALRKGPGSNTPPTPRPRARTRSEAAAARWADEAYHQRTAAAIRTASQTEAFRAKMRASWADPATRDRRTAAIQAAKGGSRSETSRAKRRAADERWRQASVKTHPIG